MYSNNRIIAVFFLLVSLMVAMSAAHLAFVEAQRLRHENFDAESGYAKPAPTEDFSFDAPFNMFTSLATGPPTNPIRRDSQSFTISTTLVGWDDYDVFLFDKSGNASEYTFLLYASVPACRENLDFYPSVALIGPLGATDVGTGATIFTDPATMTAEELSDLPFDIPAGLGVKVKHFRRAAAQEKRPAYFSSRGPNGYMYAQGWRVDCLEAPFPADCPFDEFAIQHRVNTPGKYYGVVFREVRAHSQVIQDVEFVGGVGEGFVTADFTRLAVLGQATGNGRAIHGSCREPAADRIEVFGESA